MTTTAYEVGNRLNHRTFGVGEVIDVQGDRMRIRFQNPVIGVKDFITAYAPISLEPEDGFKSTSFDAATFDQEVRDELKRAKVRQRVQDALRAEREGEGEPFDAGTLAELLTRPAEPPMRVERLIPSDSSTLVSAARKAGKTTLALNLARCLIAGEDFLGRFPVRPVDGTVALLNYEVSGEMITRWADEHGVDPERLYIVNLRGRRNPLLYPEDRERLTRVLRAMGTEAVIWDTFSRAFTGQKRSDSGEVGAFLNQLDTYTRADIGARDLILTAHAGWNGERTRDSSALEDWPDAIVRLTRDANDESQRFLSAIGLQGHLSTGGTGIRSARSHGPGGVDPARRVGLSGRSAAHHDHALRES